MKGLFDYLLENANIQLISEGRFDKDDYTKHDFKYVNAVLNDILQNKTIRLDDKGDKTLELDSVAQKQFRSDWDSGKISFPETKEAFDLLMSQYKSFPKWTQIYKNVYSGTDSASPGQLMEGLVCYMFNDPKANPEDWAKVNLTDGEVSETWINSSKWTIEFMNKQTGVSEDLWTRDNYVACRVDGGDFRLDAKYNFAVEITSLFRGTGQMKKMLKKHGLVIKTLDDLYTGQKDTWNKADIVLVHKTKAKNFFDDAKTAGIFNGESLNNFLIEKTKDGTIIPLSLKQLSKPNAHLSEVNIEEKTMPIDIIESVEHIRIGDKYQEGKYVGGVDIVCKNTEGEGVLITFLRTTDEKSNNLNIEPKPTKGVARYGKAVAVMKSLFGLGRDTKYYVIKNSNDDAIKELENNGFKIMVKPKSNYDKVTPAWKDRACIAGLLGMIEQYKMKMTQRTDKDFPVQFANFCMLCAMGLNSKGAFYKISD